MSLDTGQTDRQTVRKYLCTTTYLRFIELSLRLCKSHSHAVYLISWSHIRLKGTYSLISCGRSQSYSLLPLVCRESWHRFPRLKTLVAKKKSGSFREILVFMQYRYFMDNTTSTVHLMQIISSRSDFLLFGISKKINLWQN